MARDDAPTGFDTIHRILGGAMREAEPSTWPARPHRGGPLPVLTTRTQLALAVELCAAARALAPPPDLAAFDQLLALARRVLDGEVIAHELLHAASKPAARDLPGHRVAKLTVRAASHYLHAPPSARNAVGTSIERAAVALVGALAGSDAVRELLAFLDDLILRCDLAAQLADKQLATTSPIVHVVSRPANTKGALALVLAALEDGRYGLFVKLKQRWEWHEGDRPTVFATVPDAFMETVIRDLDATTG